MMITFDTEKHLESLIELLLLQFHLKIAAFCYSALPTPTLSNGVITPSQGHNSIGQIFSYQCNTGFEFNDAHSGDAEATSDPADDHVV